MSTIRVNVPQRLLSSLDGARTSPIVNVQRSNGQLMLQGIQNERVWGAVIDEGAAKNLTTTTMQNDVYAFVFDQKGLMAGAGIQGSKITRISR